MLEVASIQWGAILKIIGIDIMLGVDNAVVIALACASLSPRLRQKAILAGTLGAAGLRAVLLAGAGLFIELPWVKLIAGTYLLFIGFKLLMDNDEAHDVATSDNLFGAVKTIIVADFMMSLDNVLAVVSAAQTAGEHSIIYAVAGIVFSIPVIIFGAQGILRLMERFPVVIWLGAGLLGWIGVEMMISEASVANYLATLHPISPVGTGLTLKVIGFLGVIAAVLACRHFRAGRQRSRQSAA